MLEWEHQLWEGSVLASVYIFLKVKEAIVISAWNENYIAI